MQQSNLKILGGKVAGFIYEKVVPTVYCGISLFAFLLKGLKTLAFFTSHFCNITSVKIQKVQGSLISNHTNLNLIPG